MTILSEDTLKLLRSADLIKAVNDLLRSPSGSKTVDVILPNTPEGQEPKKVTITRITT